MHAERNSQTFVRGGLFDEPLRSMLSPTEPLVEKLFGILKTAGGYWPATWIAASATRWTRLL
jgi:hypothetical protein